MAQDNKVLLSVAVYKLQLAIYEFGIQDENQLFAVRSLISKSDYEDVVNERSYIKLCGYPLCNNTVSQKGRYHIVLSQHDVYEPSIYCSLRCSVNSQAFADNYLQNKRGSDLSKFNEIFNLFGRKTRGGLEEENEGKNCVLGLSSNKLQIHEKVEEDPKKTTWEMSLIGPSNAIEGYVPLRDRIPKVVCLLDNPLIKMKNNHKEEEGSNKSQSSSSRPKKKKVSGKAAKIVDGMDFMSTSIIVGNQFVSPKMPFDQRHKFESKFQESKTDQFSILELSSTSDPNVLKTELEEPKGQAGNEVVEIQIRIPEARSSSDGILTVTESSNGEEVCVGEMAQLKDISLKSSLKSLGTKKLACSVSWADDENQSCPASHGKLLCDVQEMSNTIAETSGSSNVEDVVDSSLRFASAEACADAFRQAADSVASGELDFMDAVSEAGISILPQPQFINGGDSRIDESGTNIYPQPQYIIEGQEGQDELEPERFPLKWPMKTGTLDLELFDSENSWYDTPPEGFSLSLSPFATLWMSLFGWITSSSLAYIYGSEESSEQEFLLVNGREYPRKIVLGGSRSSEIMNTLSGCLTRSLPKLVKDLRISIPISVLDKGMGCLLDTMTFMDALPPFGMKQWHVIILLFLDALSVCRIPGLTPYMTSSRMLQHKVLNDAQINAEEYGVMKDLLIPLGRAPLCGRLKKVILSFDPSANINRLLSSY